MKSILLSIFTLGYLISFAQHSSCDGSRYYSAIYNVDTLQGLVYGNSTSQGGTNADLKLDFYEPSGDMAINRPLIILAFGGSFVTGTRENLHALCMFYASKGYAAATIDYRLYDVFAFPDSIAMADVVIKAVSDMKASVRYFREDAATSNQFKIDTNLIFVGGISAGSIVALHTGMLQSTDVVQPYLDSIITVNGGYSGNSSNNTHHGSDVAGIINYSGALKSASYIDANEPPVFSVHDDQDGTVPYAAGSANLGGTPIITMEGSSLIHNNAQAVGVNSELITIPNSNGHVSYFDNAVGTDTILKRSLEFLYPLICNQPAPVSIIETDQIEMSVFPNPTSGNIQIELGAKEINTINVVDLSGRVVFTQKSNGIFTTLNIESLASGNYFIEVRSIDGATILNRKQVVKF